MTPEQAIIRGEGARRILDDQIFRESMDKLEADICEAWAQMPIRDKEGQHELLLMMQTARKFKALLQTILQTGEYEKSQLQKPQLKRVLGRFGI